MNISLSAQVRESQSRLAQLNAHAAVAARELARQRTELADLIAPDSQRYPVTAQTASGEVVKHGNRLYIAMNALPPPPKGKVYQAWTLHAGATKMSPSVTFVPNSSGVAVVPVPTPAASVVAVAVSVEPDGGSKQPTSKPTFVLKLS
jgi:anti-sigma-K factor RskA